MIIWTYLMEILQLNQIISEHWLVITYLQKLLVQATRFWLILFLIILELGLDFAPIFMKSQSHMMILKPGTAALPIHVNLKKATVSQILSAKDLIDVEKTIAPQGT